MTREEVRQGRDVVIAAAEVRSVSDTGTRVEDQLVQLMNDHERAIYNFLLVLVRDSDVAQDCAQDTFVRAYDNLRKGKPVNAAWLFTVARNRAMDEFRKKRRVQNDLESLEQVPVYHNTDEVMAVRQVLERMPPQERELLYLYDIAGFKTDEIGDMLGVRGTAIRQRLSRARARFRLIYGGEK